MIKRCRIVSDTKKVSMSGKETKIFCGRTVKFVLSKVKIVITFGSAFDIVKISSGRTEPSIIRQLVSILNPMLILHSKEFTETKKHQ